MITSFSVDVKIALSDVLKNKTVILYGQRLPTLTCQKSTKPATYIVLTL